MLDVGASIPEFSLKSTVGRPVTAEGLRGQRFVLYFYPKDDTPGCSKQACGFRDQLPQFAQVGVPVFGVSADTESSHLKFATKYSLGFPLLADPELTLLKAIGVWVQKSMYGKTYMGVTRATFVIDANGRIEKVWEKVKPEGHAEDVLAYLGGSAKKVAPAEKPAPAKKAVPAKKTAPAGQAAAAKKPAPVEKPAAAKKAAPAKKAKR